MHFNIAKHWYRDTLTPLTAILKPFSWCFGAAVAVKDFLFRSRILKSHKMSVPVIVVGNLTVGGTGKTPMVIWLAACLRAQGYRPGIISRGVGGQRHQQPCVANVTTNAAACGDEALLLVDKTECPVVLCVNRVRAAQYLLDHFDCNIIISDDGLQHARLQRDIEIVMVDAVRKFGNQKLLPAGPLREKITRLQSVDFVIQNGGTDDTAMQLQMTHAVSLLNGDRVALTAFPNKTIHAVAAIGHPQRFFNQLERAGFTVIPHAFPDHYLYSQTDLQFGDALPIFMTEKDATKCRAFANHQHWVVPVVAQLSNRFEESLLQKLQLLENSNEAEQDFTRNSCCHARGHRGERAN